jgi:hypothetical protein
MFKSLWSICAVAVIASAAVYGANEDRPLPKDAQKTGGVQFDTRIDTWVDGSVMSLDADGKKFTVRGIRQPYASAMASMQKEIQKETKDLAADRREARADEIRRAWADRLASAKREKQDAEPSDYTLSLPADGTLSIYTANQAKGVEYLALSGGRDAKADNTGQQKGQKEQPTIPAGTESKEAVAMQKLSDLKVGDKVLVGFDDGVVTDEAFAVVKK